MQDHSILLVGLETLDREKVLQALEDAGFVKSRVQEVHSGEEAVRVFRETPFDLVLAEQSMEWMSGLELAGLICDDKWKRETRVVLLAGVDDLGQRDVKKAARTGVDDIIFKPLNHQTLPARLSFLVSKNAHASGCQLHICSTASKSGLGYWEYNSLTGGFFYSQSVYEILGYPRGHEPLDNYILHTHLEPGHMQQLEKKVSSLAPKEWFSGDFCFRRRDREERFLRISGQKDSLSKAGIVSGVLQDVTQQKRVEDKLMELLEQTSMQAEALEQSGEGIVLTDSRLNVVYVNPFFDETSGFRASELIPKLRELIPGISLKNNGVADDDGWKRPWREQVNLRDKSGYVREVEVSVSPVKNKKTGEIVNYVLMIRDITERQNLQKQLQQAQKMEAIGTLAGGIAHDFNNSLMGIQGFTELALMNMSDEGRPREYLQSSLRTVQRARDLVQQILTFSGQKETTKAPMQVKPVLKEAMKLLGATVPVNIQLNVDIRDDPPMVVADPVWIHQIVMNLCTNALQAMPRGGNIDVGLKGADLDATCQEAGHDLPRGRYLLLEIQDTGCGIEPEMQERIFDPFFSTKPRGKGTGLGLSVVHGILQELAGRVMVYSTPGQGSLFRVYIPAVPVEQGIPAESDKGREPSGEVVRGRGSILFVDDQDEIVTWGVRALESLGYMVCGLSSGDRAWEVFKEQPEDYDLLVTDLSMPGTSGQELARKVKELRPGLPVIMCTGHAGADTPEKSALQVDALMQKPFSMGEFSRLIRSLLQEG